MRWQTKLEQNALLIRHDVTNAADWATVVEVGERPFGLLLPPPLALLHHFVQVRRWPNLKLVSLGDYHAPVHRLASHNALTRAVVLILGRNTTDRGLELL